MSKIEEKFKIIRGFCEKNANPEIVQKYARYFKEGYDAYGLGKKVYEAQLEKWLAAWKDELTFDNYLLLGNKLISTGKYEEASYAIGFVYSQLDKLTVESFKTFGNWLENGIVNWGHTDVLCGKVLSVFITKNILEIESFKD